MCSTVTSADAAEQIIYVSININYLIFILPDSVVDMHAYLLSGLQISRLLTSPVGQVVWVFHSSLLH